LNVEKSPTSPLLRLQQHRLDERAVPLNRPRIRCGNQRVVADLLELFVTERDRKLLDAERVGTGLVHDRVLHGRIEPLDQ
jgi:hypothetical protein